ncbi:hypothetical protein ANRL3_02682 [Anaerolineae bacterium]|nr:hypothetical protein ANRL3_02682 [Anaerolineae bacterium]
MNDHRSFQRLAGVTALLSAPLAIGSLVLVLAPVGFRFEAFEKTDLFLSVGANAANVLRWSMVLDMLGSYLLLAPAALFLWHWLKPKGLNQVELYTFCGLAYILVGAAGAAMLSVVWPPLINAYAEAAGQQREILATVFGAITNAVATGLWNTLNAITAGIWWLGIGLFLRSERRILGIVTIALGIASLLGAIGRILTIAPLATLGLSFVLSLLPIWALWLGIDLLRKPVHLDAA